MPFIGKQPTAGFASIVKDDLTPNGSTTAFTLSKQVANVNDIAVFVGNVRQEPTDAYTVSGTTLTMSEAPASGLNFYVLHIAGTHESSVVPADDTISTAKIQASAVTNAKIASGITATKLTGTIDVARVAAGTAIQVVNSANGTNYNINSPGNANATTTTEFPNYHVTITPLRTGSRFKVDGKISSVGFANTGSGQGAVFTRVAYSIAGATKVFAGIDVSHYGDNNTYANHVLSGLTGALSYTLGQSIQFQVWGYGQYFSAGQYAWNRVGGGSGLTITEIAQ